MSDEGYYELAKAIILQAVKDFNLLLKHLKGHSAFPNDEAAEKHKTKYAEIRKEKRQAAQEVTSND